MNFRYSGFISYHRIKVCAKWARLFDDILTEHVEAFGSKIFVDRSAIKAGHNINQSIADGLHESMSLLFLFVPAAFSQDHPYCIWEISHFLEYEKLRIEKLKKLKPDLNENDCSQVITVILKGSLEDVPYPLNKRKCIDLSRNLLRVRRDLRIVGDAYSEIIDAYKRLNKVFAGVENVEKLKMPPVDFQHSAKKIDFQPSFPVIKIKDDHGS